MSYLKNAFHHEWITCLACIFWSLNCSMILAVVQNELVVSKDTVLDPKQNYSCIVIKASNVTLDGRGAWLIGATEGKPNGFKGTAIRAESIHGVTLKNIRAKGWETALKVTDGNGWIVEDCDFSNNFHDPEFGWGENGRRGGIVLERVTDSVLRNNKANEVWDACVLIDSSNNRIENNDFSHTSNTCLKLWTRSPAECSPRMTRARPSWVDAM